MSATAAIFKGEPLWGSGIRASRESVMGTFVTESPKKNRAGKTFFATALEILVASRIPFLVGGGYALKRHIGLKRPARDLDVFVDPHDTQRVLHLFGQLGYVVELTFPHWLGKIYRGRQYVA